MRMVVWVIGLVLVLSGSSAFAAGDSGNNSSNIKNKKSKCVQPAPKYGGQCDKEKSNNGHGNNKDDVDSSNPGKKKVKDTDPNVDDEKKSGKR